MSGGALDGPLDHTTSSEDTLVRAAGDKHESDDVTAWLGRTAVPITSADAVPDLDDLAVLDRVLDGVRIVGFAEVTHGTREFYQLKLQMLRYLVTRLGYTVLAIEAGHSGARSLNDYLLDGDGDPATVLSGLGSVMWDVEEFAEAMAWLRAYNRSVPAAGKVRFHGISMTHTGAGRERVLAYLETVAPARAAATRALFDRLAAGDGDGMLLAHRHMDGELFRGLCDLLDFLAGHRDEFVAMTSPEAYEEAAHHVEIIRQWVGINVTTDPAVARRLPVPAKAGFNNFARSHYMARNLIDLADRIEPSAKIAVWAHTYHLGVGFEDEDHGSVQNMGRELRNHFGQRYYAMAMEFGRGEYLQRAFMPGSTLGDFVPGTVPPAPEGSLPWHLSRAGLPRFLLDLRGSGHGEGVEDWLTRRRVMHCTGWGRPEQPVHYTTMALGECYDGLVFIEDTTATTPTRNALRTVAQRRPDRF